MSQEERKRSQILFDSFGSIRNPPHDNGIQSNKLVDDFLKFYFNQNKNTTMSTNYFEHANTIEENYLNEINLKDKSVSPRKERIIQDHLENKGELKRNTICKTCGQVKSQGLFCGKCGSRLVISPLMERLNPSYEPRKEISGPTISVESPTSTPSVEIISSPEVSPIPDDISTNLVNMGIPNLLQVNEMVKTSLPILYLVIGSVMLLCGLYLFYLNYSLPTNISHLNLAMKYIIDLLDLLPSIPFPVKIFSGNSLLSLGILIGVSGMDIFLVSVGLIKCQKISVYIIITCTALAACFDLVHFMYNGYILASFSLFGFLINVLIIYIMYKKFL